MLVRVKLKEKSFLKQKLSKRFSSFSVCDSVHVLCPGDDV